MGGTSLGPDHAADDSRACRAVSEHAGGAWRHCDPLALYPSPMRAIGLLGAAVFVSLGVAFAVTGLNRDVVPGLLMAGVLWGVVALLATILPRRRR